jgi:glycosyltransferase involved in cell wall biosynthesis
LIELEKRQDEFDVVHNHLGWQALPTLDRLSIPTVTTNHNLIKGYCEDIYLNYKHLPYVALSHSYKTLNHPQDLNYVDVVYNGINCDAYHKESDPDDETAREFLLFLGRLGRDKGTAKALEIAQRLKLPLKLAGKIDDRDQTYFETDLKPHLSTPGVEFVGEAHFAQKLDLLKHAIAVVYPVQFDEPFGLVMAESMAAGTPVMALNRGAVSEIVCDGETGIVCDSVDEMVDRYGELKGISAQACRRRARNQFDQAAMVDAYEALYRKLLAGNRVLV